MTRARSSVRRETTAGKPRRDPRRREKKPKNGVLHDTVAFRPRVRPVHMLGEQLGAVPVGGGYGRAEEEYASENTKRFTVDSLLQIRRPDAAAAAAATAVDKRPITSYDGGKTSP